MDQSTLTRLRQQDRAELESLRTAINGAANSLTRDECGDWTLSGSRGAIRSCNGCFSAYIACRPPRHWGTVKKSLSGFGIVIQDGTDEGVAGLDRVPAGKDAERLRDAIGLHQTRPAPAVSISARLEGGLNGNQADKSDRVA